MVFCSQRTTIRLSASWSKPKQATSVGRIKLLGHCLTLTLDTGDIYIYYKWNNKTTQEKTQMYNKVFIVIKQHWNQVPQNGKISIKTEVLWASVKHCWSSRSTSTLSMGKLVSHTCVVTWSWPWICLRLSVGITHGQQNGSTLTCVWVTWWTSCPPDTR